MGRARYNKWIILNKLQKNELDELNYLDDGFPLYAHELFI